ncbi:MAG: CBS domain-containing protein [Pirellulales bacterium]|nr:CBS domain-containing protein [Pirellulales bacterium]
MTLQEILSEKGNRVHTIEAEATLVAATERLVEHNVGSLLVCRTGHCDKRPQIEGIVTERDVLRALAGRGGRLDGLAVRDVMTRKLITAAPSEEVGAVMGLMTEHRVRHLPVICEDGRLAGMISIGDVVKSQHNSMVLENHFLKSYLHGQ